MAGYQTFRQVVYAGSFEGSTSIGLGVRARTAGTQEDSYWAKGSPRRSPVIRLRGWGDGAAAGLPGSGAAGGPEPVTTSRVDAAMSTKNRVWRRAALAVVLLVSGCTSSTDEPAPSSSSPNPFASLEHQVQLFLDEGAVAAVVQIRWPEGEWSRAYGVRDLETRTPAQPTDRAAVASVTKTVTAVAVLKLVDDNLIGLDDPVNDVIPGFTTSLTPPAPITVRQLLSHTSGMPEVTDAPAEGC